MKKLLITLPFLALLLPSVALASTQIFMSRKTSVPGASTLNIPIQGIQQNTGATTASNNGLLPIPGVFTKLYARVTDDPGGAASWTVTLEDNTTLEALTCTISAGTTSCTDTAHTFTAAAGDVMTVRFLAAGSPKPTMQEASVAFQPTTANQTALIWHSFNGGLSTTKEDYLTPGQGGQTVTTAQATAATLLPETGTFQNLYAALAGTPTAGSWDALLRNFTANATTTITCNLPSASQCSDTSDTYAAAAQDDLVDIAAFPNTPTTVRAIGGGIGFTPTTAGDFIYTNRFILTLVNVNTWLTVSGNRLDTTGEASTSEITFAQTFTRMSVRLVTAPGVGFSRTFTLNDNGAATAASCTIANTNFTCSWTGSVAVSDGDLVDTAATNSGAVASTPGGSISYVATVATTPATSAPVNDDSWIWAWFLAMFGL